MDLYGTAALTGVVNNLTPDSLFLLDRYFPAEELFQTEEVHFDVVTGDKRLAPFVSPLVAGKPAVREGFRTHTLKPAYIKQKDLINPNAPMKRLPGEPLLGQLSPDARRGVILRNQLQQHLDEIWRRLHWMAALALREGRYTVAGENYPAQLIDFGRDAALDIAAGAGARWNDAGVDLVDQLETVAGLVQEKSGTVATEVIMGTQAWADARNNEKLLKMLDNRKGAGGPVDLGPVTGAGARFVGSIGQLDLWVYAEGYLDDAGNPQTYLPTDEVLVTSPAGVEGVKCFGVILDDHLNYPVERISSRSWVDQDPPVRQVLTQSAPLVVPKRVNACARIKTRG